MSIVNIILMSIINFNVNSKYNCYKIEVMLVLLLRNVVSVTIKNNWSAPVMDNKIFNHSNLVKMLIEYESGCEQRIGHFLKVYGYAKTIGELERLDPYTQHILETAALMHDVGIKTSLSKYGNADGENQEKEGALAARPMLETLGYDGNDIERICYLIANHHTYDAINGPDYQILVEADFLVNSGGLPDDARKENIKYFITDTGKHFFNKIYAL